ncbi:histone-lysine N-methyltransferase trithorax [Lucilia cuprina]|uniref:histone-lysine N-methyltransferase trithorax n=1 Tax=Lucilia cuprina TaxID=7375 RepID=UPI001F060EDF|nr:histone-lysine N-methyltransferase trithorax [Lucilia cuprina]XP_046805123.1 histone-lysine N-methyltransferase trithorax [Lucilia cuprina]
MGRSKFPGKPSKSINRKRISVLQLDPNNTLTAAAASAAASSTTANSTNSSAGGAAAAAATNSNAATAAANAEDEEEQTKTEENLNNDSVELEKRKNGRKPHEDDDEDEQGGPTASAGLLAATRNMNGRASTSNTTNQQQQQQNNTHSQQHQAQTDKLENTSGSSKSLTDTFKETVADNKKPSTTIASLGIKKLISSSLIAGQVNFPKRPCKKFKNLNINKPEVMLPSSSKLKLQQQQQQQQQQQHETSNNSFSILTPTPPAPLEHFPTAASLNNKLPELQQQTSTTINNELLLSSSTSASSSSLSPSLSASSAASPATRLTSTASTSSSSSSSCNINEYHKSVNHNNTIDHKINVEQHKNVNNNEDNNNNNDHSDNDVEDENSSLTFPTTSSHLEMKKCPKTNLNDHSTTTAQQNGTTSEHPNNQTKDDTHEPIAAITKDDNKTINKQNPSITPINSPSRNMEHNTLNLSPSNASQTSNNSNSSTAAATTASSAAINLNNNSNSNSSSSNSSNDKKQKKTVTFKNVLETSDDKSAVKKFYNPDNRKPLVSIIKKECLNRPLMYTRNSEFIVRPSRLTEILKNNSNIDKLNSLKFRTNHQPAHTSTLGTTTSDSCSVLAGPLSRVFGAPSEEEDSKLKHNIINFRLSKEQSDEEEDEDDDEDDEEEDEEEEEEGCEEEEELNGDGVEEEDELEEEELAEDAKHSVEQEHKLKLKVSSEEEEENQQMIVDKHFVLPKRSCRSSRLIKPNKRLIEDGIICKKSILKTATATIASAAALAAKEEKTTAPAQQPNYFGLGDYNAKECNGTSTLKSSKDITLESPKLSASSFTSSSNVFSNFGNNSTSTTTNSSTTLKPSSFVLRQPRLQFESLTNTNSTTAAAATTTSERSSNPNVAVAAAALALSASLPKSLKQAISSSAAAAAATGSLSNTASLLSPTFSLNGTSAIKNISNTITTVPVSIASSPAHQCAVCASIIHSKNLPQANKYVELSCEHCRKFISKIAKKSLAMKNSTTMKTVQLQCKADGNCVILPLNNKAGHLKNFKKVYKERCGYCWLKKCLQTLQLPKVRLNAVLPVLSNAINSSSSKSSLQDTKSKKEILEESTKLTGPIKWKPLVEPLTSSTGTSANLTETLKLNLKTNPLVENNVTFGSVPLLRPAILEKPLFLKSSLDTKTEKMDKKPLDVLKDLKTEKQESLLAEPALKSLNNKKKDKSLEKERKEVRVKEMLSPKAETDKTKESKEKLEQLMAGEVNDTKPDDNINTAATTTTTTAVAANLPTGPTNSTATVGNNNTNTVAATDKRQRIDLKGPRVKHVCRSASIVLGQPLAMFGEEGEESILNEEQLPATLEQTETKLPLTDENDNCASCKPQQLATDEQSSQITEPPLKTAKIEKLETTTKALVPVTKLSQRPHHYNTQLTAYKKQINSHIHPSLMPQRARKEPQVKCKLLISIDFWENYDPAEVCQTGFGLIVTETVAQRALCFLCGSAGQEPLIFCSCCCEPYHQYCVQDEFNLKHGSLDDTLLLNESCLSVTTQGLSSHANNAIAKLNWLCPRCTVCYTCNMSSGAKVKCQKCQKNYHSTCLGTSKRLLGADRPLICVNCLKCRSCSTTKVTKFVGNLPMCTNCFKLRKKGNYCPVCQKCYDDQDFDLKMMECGDCRQWVHAKCETLTDEQYNLLSTLPESIEFICKRCSRKSQDAKQRACEWREAVKEEFKSSLMSVLKLLSKSRQACALLKLSPRKQLKCACGSSTNSSTANNKYQPKSLQFSSHNSQVNASNETDPLASTNNIDIYEFDDRERDQVTLNHHSSLELQTKKCICQAQVTTPPSSLSLVEIKHKISNGNYVSLAEFNYDMNLVIQQANCDDLVIVYKEILSEQFPWFQNETQACTDALEEDMYEAAGGAYGLNTSGESESDYNMDCLPSSQEQQDDQDRSALLAELPPDLEEQLYNIKSRTDSRICLFCRRTGEGLPGEESRLLYCGHDCWVHTNCALWSAEVFEEIDGSLQNVHSAVARGRMIKCSVCGNRGATVGCNVKSCGEHYHYPCARSKNCAFLADKSMYCPQHAASFSNSKTSFETQFEVTRPVYVELERKRKKLVEPSKVQFHIGSLEVKQLGHILPRFSDTYESLVPVNFLCSRLYWSSKEPWKIVEYTVRTYIYNASSSSLSNGAIDLGKNFTVDHGQSDAALIQQGLKQIQQWHLSLAKGDYETAEEYDYLNNFPQHSSCSVNNTQETNATNDEEPQTNADLLPPEIKDAIFEDLPGDLLEGISMLDIFTKCMNYEDMAQGEHSKDGVSNQQLSDEDTMTSIGAFTKQWPTEFNSNWPNTVNHNHVEDALLSNNTAVTAAQAAKLQKLKKSSSPVVNSEVNAKNAIKRRKISENMLLSLNNHQRSQKKEVAAVTRRLDMEGSNKITFTWSAEKRYNLDSNQSDSKIKLMQVDGVDDSITEYRFVTQEATQAAVKCERCQCTYRNIESFQRHLNNCEPMSSSTSESETEHNSQTPELTHNTAQALTLEQLQELNNKLQQQQQRTNQMPFIQSIPTQTLTQLQGLQTANILQGVQLQGVQNLQNLQNLHNIQQLTQPQSLGGNFFISATQPDMNQASNDLQLYANTLQGLTANLNGTFTLQPTANQFTTAPQLQQNQPQLIAVSTNPDGTQQLIQLPAAQAHQTAPATYQTLQATNSDKKIVLPVTQGKPLKTMATKAAQQAAAKNKLKATTVVKPIQSKINVTTATTTNHITQPQTVNATQLINQQLLQQLQQQAQQNSAQPQLLFQTAPTQQQQPQIIMQPQPQNIISFVTTTNDGTQQPQLQYVTLPTAQQATEYKPQTQASLFTTANAQPLLQSAYLQTDASGNLVLTNGPPQTSAPLQLITTPQGPQVIGTLIQPQTLQLQGGNVLTTTTTSTAEGGIPQQGSAQTQQQQVIISGNPAGATNGLEMLTAATQPQVILATTTQPMYYGLETIVQNTVMSSQQFVSTAMPGVLSQNASFSATTTQVFQASKIEPLVDIPAGYVLVNNMDANNALLQQQQANNAANSAAQQQANQNTFIQAALQQQAQALAEQQQQQQQQQQAAQNNVYRLQTPPVNTPQGFQLQTQPQIMVTQQQPSAANQPQYVEPTTPQQNVHLVSAKVAPVAQVKRTKSAAPVATVTKVQPQVVNKVMPNVVQTPTPAQAQKIKLQNTQLQQTQTPQTANNLKSINQTQLNAMMQQQPQITITPQNLNTASKPMEITKAQLTNTTATVVAATINSTTTTTANSNKKTNMIRPLHKFEVKPKVMKTATATVVTKPTINNNVNQNNPPLQQQPATAPLNPNKMIVLKPQQQQTTTQQQQTTTAQQGLLQNNTNSTNLGITDTETNTIMPLTNLTESTETTEFMNLQHVANNHQQHYNVSDALLLDESSQMAQQTLSHCSFSNTTNSAYEQTQGPAAAGGQHNNSDNVNNILPTIQRMPQYTNINIVNPLQQYSNTTTSTSTTSSSSSTTITRPTNRVLPMQQRQYEQHSQTNCSSTSSTSTAAAAAVNTQFTQHSTTTNTQISQSQNLNNSAMDTTPQIAIKSNINKIAYEPEVKQMLLHSPQPPQEAIQNHMQQQLQTQHNLQLQQQSIQHNLAKSSPPPLAYDIGEKVEDSNPKMCLHDMNYVHNNMPDFVNPSTPEACLITDPKFPPEGEVILGGGSDCCENEEEALSSAHNEEEETEMDQGQPDDEEDDGFSLKMPSADGSDNMSMDSDEPAVKEKISKILDNLTNEDCNDSLNTNTTLEAQVQEMHCNNQYLNNTLTAENLENNEQQQQTQLTPQDANEYYTPTTEETSAFIAAQLENMKEQQQNENYNHLLQSENSAKMQQEVENSLNTNYMQNCANSLTPASNLNTLQQEQTANLSAPLTLTAQQPPHPPSRDPKRVTGPHLLYEIQSEDGFTYKSSSISEVWEKVFEAVQVARRANGLAPLPEGPLADMSGVQMIGLKTNALKYLIEQLPGVEKCNKYTPKYHRRHGSSSNSHSASSSSLSSSSSMNGNASVAASLDADSNSMDYASDQEDLTENPYECARCEPFSKRSEYDMFSWLASRHRKQPVQVFVQPSDNELVPRRGTGSNLPMAMKYRTLKETYKDYVGVFRSHIHGRGLYCTKDIEAGEMVIEYAGELIRSTLTDQRERYYNSRGIGCYMFKIDDHLVVDATMRGNAARFINHSCEPNCYSKVVDILGHKHIIIFALRRIVQGEELTYDYKFPFEDEKIPCSCSQKRCRKYLN